MSGDDPAPGFEPLALTLPGGVRSAGLARAAVVAALADADPPWLDDAALCTTELVGNAVLHAASAPTLCLDPVGAGVRITVADDQPPLDDFALRTRLRATLRARARSDWQAGGRGLLLIDALADAWGVDPRPGGKAVWCELGTGRRAPRSVGPAPEPRGAAAVRLERVPVRLLAESEAHLDQLVRTLRLAALDGAPSAARLRELADLLGARRRPHDADRDLVLRRLEATDEQAIDVPLTTAPTAAGIDLTAALIAEAEASLDELGFAMALPSDELVAYRRWWLAELRRQVAGQPPEPCPFTP